MTVKVPDTRAIKTELYKQINPHLPLSQEAAPPSFGAGAGASALTFLVSLRPRRETQDLARPSSA